MKTADLGRNEKIVLDALLKGGRAMGAYDLLDAVRDSGIRAPVQIYRALDKLVHRQLVHRIESMNAFVACAHDHAGHPPPEPASGAVAFCICGQCGNVAELPLSEQLAAVTNIVGRAGFEPRDLTLEIRGRCRDCRKG